MRKILVLLLFLSGLALSLTENTLVIGSLIPVYSQTWDGDFPESIIISGWIDPNREKDDLDLIAPNISGFDIDPINPNMAFPDLSDYSNLDFDGWESDEEREDDNNNNGDFDNGYGDDDQDDRDDRDDQQRDQELRDIMKDVMQMAKILEHRMRQKYGTNIYPFPTIVFDPHYKKRGYASYNNQIITIPPKFFSLSKGDQASTLLHEYTHYTHDKNKINPIVKNDDGEIIPLETEQTRTVSDAEMNYIIANECPGCPQYSIDLIIKQELEPKYTYVCSNFYKEEIAARKAELQGEKDGLYQLSEWYREMIEKSIRYHIWDMERALEYEKNKGRNPDGSIK